MCSGCVCIMVYIMDRVKRAFWLVRMKRAFWLVRGSLWLEYRCTNDVMSHKVLCAQITKVVYRIYETIHNPQLLDSLWRRANARNFSFQCGQFTLSPQLVNPNFHNFPFGRACVLWQYTEDVKTWWEHQSRFSPAAGSVLLCSYHVFTSSLRHQSTHALPKMESIC